MKNPYILKSKTIEALEEKRVVHQFNPKAIRNTKSLGDIVGLSTIGFHLVRVEPGDETTQHHSHEFSDEFVYILSGSCTLCLGDEEYELSANDFVGFPKNGPAHSMKNNGQEDLVYLMGGSRPDIDICNYPKIKRRMYIINDRREFVDLEHLGKISS